jgi:hypothetical protein
LKTKLAGDDTNRSCKNEQEHMVKAMTHIQKQANRQRVILGIQLSVTFFNLTIFI